MAAFIPYLYIRCQGDVSRSDSNARPQVNASAFIYNDS